MVQDLRNVTHEIDDEPEDGVLHVLSELSKEIDRGTHDV